MRSKMVWALVALNVLLLGCLAERWFAPATVIADSSARPSDYVMIPGFVQASPTQIIYIIDEQNSQLSARTFNGTRMIDMAPIDLNRIFAASDPNNKKKR